MIFPNSYGVNHPQVLFSENTAENKKVGDFFEIKVHEKIPFVILQIIGRVRIRDQKPKTTLHYTAPKKHRIR